MKTHHYILLTTVLFIILFYNENVGLNLGLLGIAYALLTWYKTPKSNKTKVFFMLFFTSIFSSVAFAWYGDFASFLALAMSVLLLQFKTQDPKLKIIQMRVYWLLKIKRPLTLVK